MENKDNMENKEVQGKQEHKRRVRYKGTHPRNYKEKYKELQPEKYADTIGKVISKGSDGKYKEDTKDASVILCIRCG